MSAAAALRAALRQGARAAILAPCTWGQGAGAGGCGWRFLGTSAKGVDGTARSLAEAMRKPKQTTVLDLSGSEDLQCMNLMCEKVGEPCICRLSRVLERLPDLRELHLAGNRLSQLPDSVWSLPQLEVLDLSDNHLEELPAAAGQLVVRQPFAGHQGLKVLRLGGNPMRPLPREVEEVLGGALALGAGGGGGEKGGGGATSGG